MPLFKSHTPPPEEPPARSNTVSSRKHGIFGGRSSSDDSSLGRAGSTYTADTSRTSNSSRSGGILSHFKTQGFPHNDPTIMAAREKVSLAEQAERAADQALQAARNQVKEARDHIRFLEKEAEDDARRAKMKQTEAKNVSRAAGHLGRHG
ncbi:hypothetical protein D9758_006424 [Tetrapyrgos nigripes]|uniref:Uncharacterized protein n=1 Tax=Tetrapyrgos nigripes TaxID=182062 RepID=A0A8H5FZZ1_9AGAR|nr:hypothetical protein D9758_006424 [Tetrapyrgos nigripes]